MHYSISCILACTIVVAVGPSSRRRYKGTSDIRLLALDMDGTLLDSNSKVLPSSVKAIQVGEAVTACQSVPEFTVRS